MKLWVQGRRQPHCLSPLIPFRSCLQVKRFAQMHGLDKQTCNHSLSHRLPLPVPYPRYAQVKRFAQMYGVHVWVVAHPRQTQDASTPLAFP